MDDLTPLERFYFENAGKDDLIAEVIELRAKLKAANSAMSKLSVAEIRLEKALAELESANKRAHAATVRLSDLKKKYNHQPARIKSEIISFICEGLSNAQIVEKGYNKSTVRCVRARMGG